MPAFLVPLFLLSPIFFAQVLWVMSRFRIKKRLWALKVAQSSTGYLTFLSFIPALFLVFSDRFRKLSTATNNLNSIKDN